MNIAEQILRSYNNRVAWGKGDGDEALIAAIDTAYPYRSDEDKANLFAMLKEHWSEYGGEGRKLYVKTTIKQWEYNILYPPKKEVPSE